MGIEKYFSPANAKKKTDTEKKPSKQKDKNDNDDFQQPVLKSKHFTDKKDVDPKAFFSTKKTSTTTTSKKEKTIKKEEPLKEEEEIVKEESSKQQEPVKKTTKKQTTTKAKPEPKKKKEETKKSTTNKKKRAIQIDDDDEEDGDYEEQEEEIQEKEEAPPAKKLKAGTPEPTSSSKKESEEAPVDKAKAAKRNYFAMMKNQEPPKLLGTRPEPVGAPNCLANMTFVISGQYETLTKESTKDIIMRYGGRVTSAVSGKTTYLLRGRDAGESKLAKAKTLGTKVLDEDDFYKLVESSAEKKMDIVPPPLPAASKSSASKGKQVATESAVATKTETSTQLWTEKYKPTEIKDIIGNKELIRRISEWLANWQELYKKGFEGDTDEMNNARALLLSGPPGIGKTTTASVAARTNGYEPLEFNASDVRSKKILEESISEMMDNRTMTEFFQAGKPKKQERLLKGKKVVLIMDEVDGMSNGDRGGSAELAQLIRKSKIPVICICNDSRSTRVAPLLKVCFEAKFKRTPAAQIRSRILSIAFKEGLKIVPNAVDELVSATQNDIRQIINILSTYRLNQKDMNYDDAKSVGKDNEKYSILGLFDIPVELLSGSSWRSKTLTQKYEIYFHDYALSHLMMHENYLRSVPNKAKEGSGLTQKQIECNELDLIAKAAEAIADGDLVDTMIHGTVQHWSLMPVHSIFSCVRPANYMEGGLRSRAMFPSWLGQNSKAGKFSRAMSDVQTRMRLKASGDKFEIRQNYIPTLNDRIFGELKEENFEGVVEYMDTYYLDRENLDIMSDVTFTGAGKAPFAQIPTKTKTAFTRAYNSKNHPILFQVSGVPIKKSVSGPIEDAVGVIVEDDDPIGDDIPQEEEQEEQDPEKDIQDTKFIKESTKAQKRKATSSGSSSSNKKLKSKK